jgi:hypothetical protein
VRGCYTNGVSPRGLPKSYVGADVKVTISATKTSGYKCFGGGYSDE